MEGRGQHFTGRGAVDSTQERILIADDEYGVRTLFEAILAECGYDCATASDGAEDLDLLANGPILLA